MNIKQPGALSMVNDQPHMVDVAALPQEQAQVGFSINQIIAIVLANLKQSAIIALTVIVLGALGIKLLPKTYEGTATLLMDYQINDPLAGQDFPLGLLDSYMTTQIELMQSPDVLMPVIEKMQLNKRKPFIAGYRGDGKNINDWVRTQLSKKLTINRSSQLIHITANSEDPGESAEIANEVAESYLAAHRRRLAGPAAERAKRYTEMIADLKRKVEIAQDNVTSFRQKAGVSNIANDNEGSEILAATEARFLEAQNARRAAEAKASGDQTVSTQVVSSPLIQSLEQQLSAKKMELAKLQTTLGPQHPQILQLRSEIDSTQRSLATQVRTYSDSAASELAAARDLERKLQKAVDEQRTKTLGIRTTQEEGAKYLVELESAEAVYKKALDGYDQTMIASGGEYTNVNLVDHATVPLKATKPNKPKLLVLAIGAGFFLGLAIPFALELFNRKVRCRDDIERDLSIPVLAEFPAIASNASGATS